MKTARIAFPLLFAGMLLHGGCKNNSNVVQGPGLLGFGDEDSIYMTCDINGAPWRESVNLSDTTNNLLTPTLTSLYSGDLLPGGSAFTGIILDTTTKPFTTVSTLTLNTIADIFLDFKNGHPATFTLENLPIWVGTLLPAVTMQYNDGNYSSVRPMQDSIGVLTIGGIDTTRNRIWGAFWFTIAPDSASAARGATELFVRNGRFNIPITVITLD